MDKNDALRVFGWQKGQNPDLNQIRARYQTLCKEHHPDVGGDPKTFGEITAAYAELRHPTLDPGTRIRAEKELTRVSNQISSVMATVKLWREDDPRIPDMLNPLKEKEKTLLKLLGKTE